MTAAKFNSGVACTIEGILSVKWRNEGGPEKRRKQVSCQILPCQRHLIQIPYQTPVGTGCRALPAHKWHHLLRMSKAFPCVLSAVLKIRHLIQVLEIGHTI